MKYILLLSLPLYVLDQITKALVLRFVAPEDIHVVVPDFFAIVHVTNDGAAFGSFKNNNLFSSFYRASPSSSSWPCSCAARSRAIHCAIFPWPCSWAASWAT
jgi:lipoprotein signal peptidase